MYGSITMRVWRARWGIMDGLDWIWNPPGKVIRHLCEHKLETEEVGSRAWVVGRKRVICSRECHRWVELEAFDRWKRRPAETDPGGDSVRKKASRREGARLGTQFNSILGDGWLRDRQILYESMKE